MNTDNTKSLLDVAMEVRKEHQDEIEKKAAEEVVPEAEAQVVGDPPEEPQAT